MEQSFFLMHEFIHFLLKTGNLSALKIKRPDLRKSDRKKSIAAAVILSLLSGVTNSGQQRASKTCPTPQRCRTCSYLKVYPAVVASCKLKTATYNAGFLNFVFSIVAAIV
jgi:hypothetical protein